MWLAYALGYPHIMQKLKMSEHGYIRVWYFHNLNLSQLTVVFSSRAIFQHLEEEQLLMLYRAMFEVTAKAGDVIIEQGLIACTVLGIKGFFQRWAGWKLLHHRSWDLRSLRGPERPTQACFNLPWRRQLWRVIAYIRLTPCRNSQGLLLPSVCVCVCVCVLGLIWKGHNWLSPVGRWSENVPIHFNEAHAWPTGVVF